MSDFAATDVAFTGIRFVRHNLRTVAIWAGVQLVLSIALQVAIVATMGPAMASFRSLGTRPNPQQSLAMIQNILPFEGVAILVSLVVYAIVYATMNRAVLRPADSGFAFLRLGMDEVRQFLLLLIWVVLGFVFEIVVAIVAGIVFGLAFGLGRTSQPFVPVLMVLVMLAVTFLAWTPFSLCFAETFDRKRVMPFDSLRLVGPRYWKVCGAYALVLVVGFVVWLLATIIAVALVGAVGGGLTMASLLARPPVATVGAVFALPSLIALLIGAVLTPLLWTLLLMPAPEIYRQLSGRADPALDPSTFD